MVWDLIIPLNDYDQDEFINNPNYLFNKQFNNKKLQS